jgi:hypothetical protein
MIYTHSQWSLGFEESQNIHRSTALDHAHVHPYETVSSRDATHRIASCQFFLEITLRLYPLLVRIMKYLRF